MDSNIKWFLKECMHSEIAGMDRKSIEMIARLLYQADCATDTERNQQYDIGLYSAMLADICETLYPNLDLAPTLLLQPHAGWACGPFVKPDGATYLDSFYKGKEPGEPPEDWKKFLDSIQLKEDKDGRKNQEEGQASDKAGS